MQTLRELIVENEEENMTKTETETGKETKRNSTEIDMLDQHLQNSIESIDMASMFFMEGIPSKLLGREDSTWRDVSMHLIKHTMDAIMEITPLSEPTNQASVS